MIHDAISLRHNRQFDMLAPVSPATDRGRKHGALRPQKPLRLIRDGEVGGSGLIYLTPTRYTVTTGMILY